MVYLPLLTSPDKIKISKVMFIPQLSLKSTCLSQNSYRVLTTLFYPRLTVPEYRFKEERHVVAIYSEPQMNSMAKRPCGVMTLIGAS